MTGEFVAEVGGERMRLKPGDSLLMPMKSPAPLECSAGFSLWRNSSLHTRRINGNRMGLGCAKAKIRRTRKRVKRNLKDTD